MPVPLPLSYKELEELCSEYGTPLQLYSEKAIVENARQLLSTFCRYFPHFEQFFAVKALPNPAILKLLTDVGFGLDCSSLAELHIAKQLGVPGNKVMYTSNYTSKKDLGIAFDQGVIINLDDISLVHSLIEARGKCPDLLCFRLNPGMGRTDSETKSNVLGGPDAKFGVSPGQIAEAYKLAKEHGAKRFGIHMMTGSCVLMEQYWEETVTMLLNTLLELRETLNISFEFVNIGGGLGIPYKSGQEKVNLETLVPKIRKIFDKALVNLPENERPVLKMENGRYITGPYGWLVSRCQAVKRNEFGTYFGLDACMANLMRPGMYGSYHHISVPKHEDTPESGRKQANVVGTLCENNDWFAKDRLLPSATGVNDLFVIHDTGAHSHSMGFQYNGKLRAPEVLLRTNGGHDLIRKRETIEDLYANTKIPDDLT